MNSELDCDMIAIGAMLSAEIDFDPNLVTIEASSYTTSNESRRDVVLAHKFASALFGGEAHLKRQLEAHRSAKSVFHCRPPNTRKVFPIRNSPGQQTMKRRLPPLKRVYSPESKPIFGLWLKLIPVRRFQCRDFAVDASNA